MRMLKPLALYAQFVKKWIIVTVIIIVISIVTAAAAVVRLLVN
jgi:hypothetical protein